MTRPKKTSEFLSDVVTPACPHCTAEMGGASIRFEDLVLGWPFDCRPVIRADGYTDTGLTAGHGFKVDCPECRRPSHVTIAHNAIILTACRTDADIAYEASRASEGMAGTLRKGAPDGG